ncbi:MAG: 7-carboxy-7-deazaguanine synthase QueE [Thermoplasmata archaeon]
MIVNEIFKSLQGEGIEIGVPTVFVRLSGCPLRCKWCDQQDAWVEGKSKGIEEVVDEVAGHDCPYVCVTGGEPLAQDDTIRLVSALIDAGYMVSVETGGSMPLQELPCSENLMVSLDIKCPSSGMHERMDFSNIELLSPSDQLKFVIADREDYEYAKSIIEKYGPQCSIVMQPVGGKDLRWLAESVLEDGLRVRVLPQLHKVIWGDKKGV